MVENQIRSPRFSDRGEQGMNISVACRRCAVFVGLADMVCRCGVVWRDGFSPDGNRDCV